MQNISSLNKDGAIAKKINMQQDGKSKTETLKRSYIVTPDYPQNKLALLTSDAVLVKITNVAPEDYRVNFYNNGQEVSKESAMRAMAKKTTIFLVPKDILEYGHRNKNKVVEHIKEYVASQGACMDSETAEAFDSIVKNYSKPQPSYFSSQMLKTLATRCYNFCNSPIGMQYISNLAMLAISGITGDPKSETDQDRWMKVGYYTLFVSGLYILCSPLQDAATATVNRLNAKQENIVKVDQGVVNALAEFFIKIASEMSQGGDPCNNKFTNIEAAKGRRGGVSAEGGLPGLNANRSATVLFEAFRHRRDGIALDIDGSNISASNISNYDIEAQRREVEGKAPSGKTPTESPYTPIGKF